MARKAGLLVESTAEMLLIRGYLVKRPMKEKPPAKAGGL
jgi:hypothetical protein